MFQFYKRKKNSLFNDIDRLKKTVNNPEEYIWEYFDKIKNEIDLEYEHILINHADDYKFSKSEIDVYNNIKTSWIDLINEIDILKNEALNRISSIQFDSNQFVHKISKIEAELNIAILSKNILNIITFNQINFKKIKKSIDVLNFNINKYFFNGKTIIYINRKKCDEYECLNGLNTKGSTNFQDLIGRLMIIQDYYIDNFDYINLFSR